MTALRTNVQAKTVQEHYRAYVAARHARESAAGAERATLAIAKQAGIDPADLRQAYADYRADPEEVRRDIARRIQYAAFLGKDIGFQVSMAEEVEAASRDPDQQIWAAGEAGYLCGKSGGDRVENNVFEAGTELHVAWDREYLRGQAEIAARMTANGGVKPARTGRKRREPGAAGEAGLTPNTPAEVAATVAQDDGQGAAA
jgi:hypothetical protein